MGTAPSEATSTPSACRSSRASPLRNSPQTLCRGAASRSISVTLRPFRASEIEAAQPATPPPRMRTSSCKAMLLIHLMFNQFVARFRTSNRRPKNSLRPHSVQIVILEPARSWLDGRTYRGDDTLDSLGNRVPEGGEGVNTRYLMGRNQFLCCRIFGDSVGRCSASRTDFSETYPKADASVYGRAFRDWKNHRP